MDIRNINNREFFNVGLTGVSSRSTSVADSGAALPTDLAAPTPSVETEITLQTHKFTQIPSFNGIFSKKLSPNIDASTLQPKQFYRALENVRQSFEGMAQPELQALHKILQNHEENIALLKASGMALLAA